MRRTIGDKMKRSNIIGDPGKKMKGSVWRIILLATMISKGNMGVCDRARR